MIIMKIMGGFASQIYKLILGVKFAEVKRTELILDVSEYYDGYFRPYCLNKLNLPEFCTVRSYSIAKIYPDVKRINTSADMERMLGEEGDYYIFKEETDYAEFFLKHPEFELGSESPYISNLSLKENSDFINKFKQHIQNCTSVAVHVRRGDYVALGQESSLKFYKAAIAFFYEKNKKTHFYFFSNDQQWVKEQFGENQQFHYVSALNGNVGDMEELFCMAYCNYRILSNYSGYGLLANVLSYFFDKDGFALMEEANPEAYEYRGIEGRIQYLSLNQIKYYEGKCKEICWLARTKYSVDNQKNLDEIGVEGAFELSERTHLLYDRLMSYRGDSQKYRDCLEMISMEEGNSERIIRLWEEVYHNKFDKEYDFLVITTERFSKWFRRGMFEIAIRLSRIGQRVRYINLSNINQSNEISWIRARNMDGKDYGFTIYEGSYKGIREVLERAENSIILQDCKLPFGSMTKRIMLQSKRAKKRQHFLTKSMIKSHLINFCKYIFRKEPPASVISRLDWYWETFLMQEGSSLEDINQILDGIYIDVIGNIRAIVEL